MTPIHKRKSKIYQKLTFDRFINNCKPPKRSAYSKKFPKMSRFEFSHFLRTGDNFNSKSIF